MLTRLKVTGFKNLVDVDISFGPFTCIAGANGSGKSNLFDAIQFLSNTTKSTLIEAASKVRNEEGRGMDVRNLFHRRGDQYDEVIKYYVEMIIPSDGIDDLGQKAKASATVVRYRLELRYKVDDNSPLLGSLEILHESLRPLKKITLGFQHTPEWRESVVKTEGPDRPEKYISTTGKDRKRIIILHLDLKKQGRRKKFLAENMPSTVLSTVDALENPTASLCRREMQSWKVLQLEPSSLRKPDRFSDPPYLGADGSHLAAYLYRLARNHQKATRGQRPKTWIYDQITSRLADLIKDIDEIHVERNEMTQLLTLMATDCQGTTHPAHSLSDGTLRFLALAALEQDPGAGGVFCLEEPENGINPKRIVSMIILLESIAMDPEWPVDKDNPLRQIIINTHSPLVVANVHHDCLLVAKVREKIIEGRRLKSADFSWLPDTWRAKAFPDIHPMAKGEIVEYLNHIILSDHETDNNSSNPSLKNMRVAARPDLAPYLPFISDADE